MYLVQAFHLEVALDYRHDAMVALLVEGGSTVSKHIFPHSLSDRYDPLVISTSTGGYRRKLINLWKP